MNGSRDHRHRILTTKGPFEFSGCAYPERCDPRAHDNASFISYCVCGMVRLANVGGDEAKTVERGPWIPRTRDHWHAEIARV